MFELFAKFDSEEEQHSSLFLKQQANSRFTGRRGIQRARILARKIPIDRVFLNHLIIHSTSHGWLENRLYGEVLNFTYWISLREETAYRMYWFLNSPDFGYTRSQHSETSSALDYSISGFLEERVEHIEKSQFGRDAIVLEINGKKVAIGAIRKEIVKYGGTFIRTQGAKALTAEELKAIQSVFTFLSAQEILYVGSTVFNSASSPIRTDPVSILENDLAFLKYQGVMPLPFRLTEIHTFRGDPEATISEMIREYLSNQKEFSLDTILWYIRLSWRFPIDVQMQPLATAFDIFKEAWFNSSRSKSKGHDIDDKRFNEIIRNYIEQIRQELGEKPTTQPIINRILKANQMSLSEKSRTFFSELELEIGKVEKSALSQRHSVVHGMLGTRDYGKLSRNLRAFYCMLNRIILRTLKQEIYSDRTSYGDPVRPIKESLMGTPNPIDEMLEKAKTRQNHNQSI